MHALLHKAFITSIRISKFSANIETANTPVQYVNILYP